MRLSKTLAVFIVLPDSLGKFDNLRVRNEAEKDTHTFRCR